MKFVRPAKYILECATIDLEFRPGGRVGIAGVSGKEVSFQMIAARSLNRVGGLSLVLTRMRKKADELNKQFGKRFRACVIKTDQMENILGLLYFPRLGPVR